MLYTEDLRVASEHDTLCGILPKQPCRKSDADADGFEGARGHIDDEAIYFTAAHSLQAVSDQVDVPIRRVGNAGVYCGKGFVDEAAEVLTQHGLEEGLGHFYKFAVWMCGFNRLLSQLIYKEEFFRKNEGAHHSVHVVRRRAEPSFDGIITLRNSVLKQV